MRHVIQHPVDDTGRRPVVLPYTSSPARTSDTLPCFTNTSTQSRNSPHAETLETCRSPAHRRADVGNGRRSWLDLGDRQRRRRSPVARRCLRRRADGQGRPRYAGSILVHLEQDHASDILNHFTERLRNDVVLRIATLEGIQPEALKELNDVMLRLLSGSANIKKSAMGGVRSVAEILNFMGTANETTVILARRRAGLV